MDLARLLAIWRDVGLGQLRTIQATFLNAAEWAELDGELRAQGAEIKLAGIADYGIDDGGRFEGIPTLAEYWPAHLWFKVELTTTGELFNALVAVLRSRWRTTTGARPPAFGPLGSAAELVQLWQHEAKCHGDQVAFERCRDRMDRVVRNWKVKLACRLTPATARKARTPRALALSYDYRIFDDQWENRVTAHFQKLRLSSTNVSYERNDRAIHDLMVRVQGDEDESLSYDELARVLAIRVVPSKLSRDDRKAPCEAIRKAISRFNQKWSHSIRQLAERLRREGRRDLSDALAMQGPPLRSIGRGTWKIMVSLQTKGARKGDD